MVMSAFLNVNGYDFPCPDVGFSYEIVTTVDGGRNAKNAAYGQRVSRDIFKFDAMVWTGLEPEVWQRILQAVEPFYVPVTFEDYRTGEPITITMYPGNRKAEPLSIDPNTHKVTMYKKCSFNLVDAGWE